MRHYPRRIEILSRWSSAGSVPAVFFALPTNTKGAENMGKYLIEASKKNGIFEPFDQRKHYIVTQEKLAKMLANRFSWAVWSANRINSETDIIEALAAQNISVEILE